jgi:MoaA/NifB/PqqE/SkfB family radical SAM enzyme
MSSKIIKNYLPELSAFLFGRSKPSMITVNVTNQCNQNCIYCEIGQNHANKNKTLSHEDLVWIIDEMSKIKIKKIALCGGEPFLFEGIIDIIAYASNKNIRCSVTTNGMNAHILNEKEFNILKASRTEINISIDSFDENIQNYTRGTSSAFLNALKSIHKLTENKIPVTVLTAISKYNYHDLFKSLNIAYERGIKQVLFQPIIYYSNYPDRETIDKKSQLNVSIDKLPILIVELKKILQYEKQHNIKTNVYRILPWIEYYLITAETQNGKWFFNDVLNKFFCREIYAIIDISYDGGIQPCGLTRAKISIHENRQLGLMTLWLKATEEIKGDLINENYYKYCNACCHHFSRNMLASIIKHPFKNRNTIYKIMPLLLIRIRSRIIKKILRIK